MKYLLKKYEDYGQNEAMSIILSEIVNNKVSGGWAGTLESLYSLKSSLAKFNVYYADDMFGEWRLSE
jgi:hypothetical protein